MTDAQIIPLNEGYYTIGFDKIFHTFNPAADVLEERSKGSLLVEIQPFLIKTPHKNILIDAGLGFKNDESGTLKIIENLAEHGLRAHEITDVIMSHLHKDHAGGLFYEDENQLKLTFENAVHHINVNEYKYACDPVNELSYETEKVNNLDKYADIQWFNGNKIFDFVTYEEDGGHCPFHTSFLISVLSGKYFFGGDVAPQIKQLKFKYIAKYDFDGKKSAELRTQYAERGKAEDWIFLFYHDVNVPMAKI